MSTGRVTIVERRRAAKQLADIDAARSLGFAALVRVGRQAELAALAAFRAGTDPGRAAVDALTGLKSVLADAALYAALRGIVRSRIDLEEQTGISARLASRPVSAYVKALDWLKRRAAMPPEGMARLEARIDAHLARVLADVSADTQSELQRTVAEIYRQQLPTVAGAKVLRKKWSALGLSERNSFQLEAIVRTQTQLAYAAGAASEDQAPAMEEMLWGYKYVTAGDDRVRPAHKAMDGTTLPVGDPFWRANKPPNGWACRCQLVRLYRQVKVTRPPAEITVGEQRVAVEADEGFQFDPAELLR